MSETPASLRRQITSAGDLESVVRTMKAMAASNIAQYEAAVHSLDEYYHTVQLGLAACFRHAELPAATRPGAHTETGTTGAVVFGSDQGLVGQFNDVLVDFVVNTLAPLPGKKLVWPVGERIQARLADTRLTPGARFMLPTSINAITPLVGQILTEIEAQRGKGMIAQVYLFYNRPTVESVYAPVSERLLPLDAEWRHALDSLRWPTKRLPEVMNDSAQTRLAFVREYLFVSLFRACAESLASENASRLAAMQRAEKNIDERLQELNRTFHRLRQAAIDEELFDVVAGFEALTGR